jgi:hypothetical protein
MVPAGWWLAVPAAVGGLPARALRSNCLPLGIVARCSAGWRSAQHSACQRMGDPLPTRRSIHHGHRQARQRDDPCTHWAWMCASEAVGWPHGWPKAALASICHQSGGTRAGVRARLTRLVRAGVQCCTWDGPCSAAGVGADASSRSTGDHPRTSGGASPTTESASLGGTRGAGLYSRA